MSKEDQNLPVGMESRRRKRVKCPLEYKEGGKIEIQGLVASPDISPEEQVSDLLAETIGVGEILLADDIVHSSSWAMPLYKSREYNKNVIAQALSDMGAKDSMEARLIAQFTTLSSVGMSYLSRAQHAVKEIEGARMFEADGLIETHNNQMNIAIKLLRLCNETVGALTNYRRKGEQKVIVQHVNVNEGGQAVVAGLMDKPGGGGNNKN